MKIRIFDADEKKGLKIWIPTNAIKWKVIYRFIGKKTKGNFDAEEFYKIAKPIFKSVKRYIKENGHFELVNIVSSDGSIVKITL